ncbi:MAG: hypothetical protein WCY51_08655 [Sulfurimonas sp.]|uniref:hypothetical protein n=1 Tax=Sulfurimonas sp. TaxID=2022749 RepID=UPI0025E87A0D|nr:hypothetical protein [Sulfurimonas sp.]MCK9455304.1 hypothetical protein [Sulfurimonas sp.]
MSRAKKECISFLEKHNVNLDSEIDFEVNGKLHTLSFRYILDTFMMASDESQQLFLTALKKSLKSKGMGVERFFEGMGQLLLMTHLSKNIEI